MKKIRSTFLGILSLLVVLVLAVGCYRPAAPDVTPTSAGGAEAATPGEEVPDIEATAIARSTESAATMEAQTPAAEGEEGEEEEEATEASTQPAPTATSEPTTAPTTPAETPAPTSAPTAAPTSTPAPPETGTTTHIVQPGENMFRIALRYGTTVEAISQANGIANPRLIYVGQQLTIPVTGDQPAEPAQPAPTGTTYVVQPGDNLFRIALRYNMNYVTLAQYNGIGYPYYVYVGQVIRIPPQ